jgi:hypothetical protein
MNDEPLIRLRPRKSKHGPNEDPQKYTGILRSMSGVCLAKISFALENLRFPTTATGNRDFNRSRNASGTPGIRPGRNLSG